MYYYFIIYNSTKVHLTNNISTMEVIFPRVLALFGQSFPLEKSIKLVSLIVQQFYGNENI